MGEEFSQACPLPLQNRVPEFGARSKHFLGILVKLTRSKHSWIVGFFFLSSFLFFGFFFFPSALDFSGKAASNEIDGRVSAPLCSRLG